jgi:hypothetical protein
VGLLGVRNRNLKHHLLGGHRPVAALALLAAPASSQNASASNPINSIGVTCSTSATRLPAAFFANGFVITASSGNSGTVYIGGSNVNTTAGTGGYAYPLAANASISYGASNSANGYFICTNGTDTFAITGN